MNELLFLLVKVKIVKNTIIEERFSLSLTGTKHLINHIKFGYSKKVFQKELAAKIDSIE